VTGCIDRPYYGSHSSACLSIHLFVFGVHAAVLNCWQVQYWCSCLVMMRS